MPDCGVTVSTHRACGWYQRVITVPSGVVPAGPHLARHWQLLTGMKDPWQKKSNGCATTKARRVSRTSVPVPVPKETPTLRLGSMLQTVREQSKRPEAGSYSAALPNRRPDTLSTEELDAPGKTPRPRLARFVFAAGVTLAALCATTRTDVKALFHRIALAPMEYPNQELVVEPVHAAEANTGPVNTTPIDRAAVEMAPNDPPHALSSHVGVRPSAGTGPMIPRRPGHSESTRRSHSIPLRGYAWSPPANALVRIEPPQEGAP